MVAASSALITGGYGRNALAELMCSLAPELTMLVCAPEQLPQDLVHDLLLISPWEFGGEKNHSYIAEMLRRTASTMHGVLSVTRPETERLLHAVPMQAYRVHIGQPQRQSAWVEEVDGQEILYIQLDDQFLSADISARKILGFYMMEVYATAALAGALIGLSIEQITKAIIALPPLPHQLDEFFEYDGVTFIDDTAEASFVSCMNAVTAYPASRRHLILAGDYSDEGEMADIASFAIRHAVTVSILPGKSSRKMVKLLLHAGKKEPKSGLILDKSQLPYIPTLLSGLQPHLQEGDVVLFSPGVTTAPELVEEFRQGVRARYDKHHE
jgi:UDP-N-acetylmuramoylalanine-D-glutamate ligase